MFSASSPPCSRRFRRSPPNTRTPHASPLWAGWWPSDMDNFAGSTMEQVQKGRGAAMMTQLPRPHACASLAESQGASTTEKAGICTGNALAPIVCRRDACSNAETGFAELATMLEAIIAAAGKASKAGRLAAIAFNLAKTPASSCVVIPMNWKRA